MPKNYQEHAHTIDLFAQGNADLRGDELRDAAKYLRKQGEENKLLRGFANAIMAEWPDSWYEGDEIQEMAIKYGLLREKYPRPTEPCSETCSCAEYSSPKQFAEGMICYRKTELLLGDPI